MKSPKSIRAREPKVLLATLPDPAWVECPRCGKPARVVRQPHRYRMHAKASLTCGHCTYRRDSEVFHIMNSDVFFAKAEHSRCARCGGDKLDISKSTVKRHSGKVSVQARCMGCGRRNVFTAPGGIARVSDGHDHWFGLPLVLKANYGSRLVWAYIVEHIDMLEGWLKAALRERSLNPYYMTMAARLPAWMKAAHARQPVIKALGKMREIARREGLS